MTFDILFGIFTEQVVPFHQLVESSVQEFLLLPAELMVGLRNIFLCMDLDTVESREHVGRISGGVLLTCLHDFEF